MSVRERRDRERERRRDSILDAAERVFFAAGLSATVEEIAAEAELAKGTVYAYFPSKEEIYMTLVDRALTVLHAEIAAAVREGASPDENVRRIAATYRIFAERYPHYFKLLNETSYPIIRSSISDRVLDAVYRHSSEIWAVITAVLQEGIERGLFRGDIPAFHMAVLLWTNASGLLRLARMLAVPNIWQGKSGPFSFDSLDIPSLFDAANELLLEAFSRR
ncbi:MAG: TetR/AcrR family transcriptional regulator [Bacteroidota bacterium]|nr:TetR/AcrR family transcriptional regulator [Bacteroidota bacterium]